MRILVVADVHANLAALQAVLAEAGEFETLWSLGDVVGYGAEPGACIELLRRYPLVAVAGNHDLAAVGAIGLEEFNPFAAEAARWTATQLSAAEKAWLSELPQVAAEGQFTLVHGSLMDPAWGYLFEAAQAEEHLRRQTTSYGLVGHTHVPAVFFEAKGAYLEDGASPSALLRTGLALAERRFVANAGGVGQPRDGDPRAAYAVLDTEARRMEFRRAAYDIETTQAKIRAAGLPAYLAERLARGR